MDISLSCLLTCTTLSFSSVLLLRLLLLGFWRRLMSNFLKSTSKSVYYCTYIHTVPYQKKREKEKGKRKKKGILLIFVLVGGKKRRRIIIIIIKKITTKN